MIEKKLRYAKARMAGMGKKAAALKAGYAEKSAQVTASKMEQDREINAYWRRHGWSPDGVTAPPPPVTGELPPMVDPETGKTYADPLAYFERVMNDAGEDPRIRLDAAKALATYTRAKAGEVGKKEQKNEAAASVAKGRFSPAKPPLSVVPRA